MAADAADPADPADSADPGTAQRVVAALRGAGLVVATAESLTAGQVSAALADVPGASDVLRGGVVAYATDAKASVLGVPAGLLERTGPVDGGVAVAMARGAAALLRADLGVATTGVAGPGPHDGHPAGTVWVAVAAPGEGPARSRRLALDGDRATVRSGATAAALELLLSVLPVLPVLSVLPAGAPAAPVERAGGAER